MKNYMPHHSISCGVINLIIKALRVIGGVIGGGEVFANGVCRDGPWLKNARTHVHLNKTEILQTAQGTDIRKIFYILLEKCAPLPRPSHPRSTLQDLPSETPVTPRKTT
jgi:hypothetical protein